MYGATPSPPEVLTRRVTFPLDRCAGCDHRLLEMDEAPVGEFPVFTPNWLLLIRCRLCAGCLDQPELREPLGLRRQALALVAHLWHWWVERPSESAPWSPEIQTTGDALAQQPLPTGSWGDFVPQAAGNPASAPLDRRAHLSRAGQERTF